MKIVNRYVIVLVLICLAGIAVSFYFLNKPKLPKCNPYWPQSYSDIPLELQPCPTPVLK